MACQTIARIVVSTGASPKRSAIRFATVSIKSLGSTPRSVASVATGLPRS